MKTILITGGNSYIGEKVIEILLKQSYIIIALVRQKTYIFNNFDKYKEIIFDLEEDISKLLYIENEIDCICHLAAYIPKNSSDPDEASKCLMINSIGTLNLLKFAEIKQIKHFIYLTGANVYKNNNGTSKEEDSVFLSERSVYYLSSKLVGEYYVNAYDLKGIIKSTVLRASSIYGNLKKHDFITKTIFNLFNDKTVTVTRNGFRADLVYIDDVVEILAKSIIKEIYGVFNLSTGKLQSIEEAVKLIHKNFNKSPEKIIYIESNYLDRGFPAINSEKASKTFDFEFTNFELGVKNLIYKVKNNID